MCSKPIFCSKIALKGKTCSRLLKPQKVAPNAKSCSKVAEHNRDRPTHERSLEIPREREAGGEKQNITFCRGGGGRQYFLQLHIACIGFQKKIRGKVVFFHLGTPCK